MERMETLTNLQSEGCLLLYQKASVLECLARMELEKHPSSVWYSNINYYFHFRKILGDIMHRLVIYIRLQMIGLVPPTSGAAYVHGMDIKTDMDDIYTNMGVCPQHEYDLALEFIE